MRIAHVSSVHSARDPRINKQLKTLAAAGHEVHFITGDLAAAPRTDIQITTVSPGNTNRIKRMGLTALRCILVARRLGLDVCHLHDPELLPFAHLLIKRSRVIYDVHEDYVSGVNQKTYLPSTVRAITVPQIARIEEFLSRRAEIVIAERYYRERFPTATAVLNYPPVSLTSACQNRRMQASKGLLYTGGLTVDRGARILAELSHRLPDFEFHLVGKCGNRLHDELMSEAGPNFVITGKGRHVDHREIVSAYEQDRWLAGLAIFPPTPHYVRKELTKFFEYMAVGLPVIASNFSTWRELIEDQGCGICVDPLDLRATEAAVRSLAEDPHRAREMGEQGRKLVQEKFNWEGQAKKLVDLYRTLS